MQEAKKDNLWNPSQSEAEERMESEESEAFSELQEVNDESQDEPQKTDEALESSLTPEKQSVPSWKRGLTPKRMALGAGLFVITGLAGIPLWMHLQSEEPAPFLMSSMTPQGKPVKAFNVPLVEQKVISSQRGEPVLSHEKDIRTSPASGGEEAVQQEMASISREDLKTLMETNVQLQKEVEAALQTIRQTKEEKEQAFKQMSEWQTRYKELYAAQKSKESAPAPKRNTLVTAQTQPKKAVEASKKATTTAQEKVSLPFALVGLTDSFIVVRQGKQFNTLQIGQSLDGITLIGIDPVKNRITTNTGEYALLSVHKK